MACSDAPEGQAAGKAMLRKAEPRTADATTSSLQHILSMFSPAECAAYLKNAGYASV